MSRIKGKDTTIELVVRKYLSDKGFKYRIHYKLLGKPDIVFVTRKIAIFVHGCFWHGHKNCKESHIPKTNRYFWKNKIKRNTERDKKNIKVLKRVGWHVLVIYECEIEKGIKLALLPLIKMLVK